MPAIQCI